jgi:hypothetical protein
VLHWILDTADDAEADPRRLALWEQHEQASAIKSFRNFNGAPVLEGD